jgi:DUF1680 family protein
MEQALYNTVLAGMALDGRSFFYVNPLSVNPVACHRDERLHHVKPVRQKWFGCACCPPNLARIVSSIGSYGWTTSDDTLYTHLYMGGKVSFKGLELEVTSSMPWEGEGEVRIHAAKPETCTLAFRVPGWCENATIASEGKQSEIRDGYCYLTGEWKDGDVVTLKFPMRVRMQMADARVRENIGKVAFTRGPVTYCIEGVDNEGDIFGLSVFEKTGFELEKSDYFSLPVITADGCAKVYDGQLYSTVDSVKYENRKIKFIPFYGMENRGETDMLVWIPAK